MTVSVLYANYIIIYIFSIALFSVSQIVRSAEEKNCTCAVKSEEDWACAKNLFEKLAQLLYLNSRIGIAQISALG